MNIESTHKGSSSLMLQEAEIVEGNVEDDASVSNAAVSSNVLMELQCQLDSSLGFTKIEFLQSGVDFITEGESFASSARLCESLQQTLRKILVQLDVENNCAFITLLNDQSLSSNEVNGVCDLLESQKIFNHHSSCYVVSVPTVRDHDGIYEGGAIFLAQGQTGEDQVLIILKRLTYMKDELRSVLASKAKPAEEGTAPDSGSVLSTTVTSSRSTDDINRDARLTLMEVAATDDSTFKRNDETSVIRKRSFDGVLIIDDGKNVHGSPNDEDNFKRAKNRKIVHDDHPLSINADSNTLAAIGMDSTLSSTTVTRGLHPIASDGSNSKCMKSQATVAWISEEKGCEILDYFFRIQNSERVIKELVQSNARSLATLRHWSSQLITHSFIERNGWTCTVKQVEENLLPCDQFFLSVFRIDSQNGAPVVSHAIQVLSSGQVKISIDVSPHTQTFSATHYTVNDIDELINIVKEIQSYNSCRGIKVQSDIHKFPTCINIDSVWFSKFCKRLVPVNTIGNKNICHECKLVKGSIRKHTEFAKLSFGNTESKTTGKSSIAKNIYEAIGNIWTTMRLNDKVKEYKLLPARHKR